MGEALVEGKLLVGIADEGAREEASAVKGAEEEAVLDGVGREVTLVWAVMVS